jgi:hypothetical protein
VAEEAAPLLLAMAVAAAVVLVDYCIMAQKHQKLLMVVN